MRPFKKFFCDRPDIFKIPKAAMAVWLYHYCREGASRSSWPKIETICEDCDLGFNTVKRARTWLVKNGWLLKVSHFQFGELRIPKYRVTRGKVPKRVRGVKPQNGPWGGPQNGASVGYQNGATEVDSFEVDSIEVEEGTDMSFKNNITDKAREILKVRIFPTDQGWEEMTSLKRVYGATLVEQTFAEWARTVDEDVNYPLTSFLRVADSWISGNRREAEVKSLVLDLAVLSDGEVLFSQKQALEIGRLLATYPEADIKAAFVEFLEGLDDYSRKFAAKDFSEKAPQLMYARKQRQLKQEQTQKLVENTIAQQRAKAEAEIATQPKPIDFENFQF